VTKRSQISKLIVISKALIIYIAYSYTLISKSTGKWPSIPFAGVCVEI